MGLKGTAAIVGAAQYKPEKYAIAPQMFHLEQVADLAAQALADAGLKASDIDGLCINGPHFHEASSFVPAMAAEYLGVALNFAEVVDLGGTTAVGMIWRAAAAIELGICQAVLCVIPQRMAPFGPDDDPSAMARAMAEGSSSGPKGAMRWGITQSTAWQIPSSMAAAARQIMPTAVVPPRSTTSAKFSATPRYSAAMAGTKLDAS